MKQFIKKLLPLLAVPVFTFGISAEAANSEYVMLVVNDARLDCGDTQPEIVDGRTYAPLRALSEELGAEVTWIEGYNTALVQKNGVTVRIVMNDPPAVYMNGKRAPGINCYYKQERIMLPYRFIAESLGYEVSYLDGYSIAVVSNEERTLSDDEIILKYGDEALEEKKWTLFAVNPLAESGFAPDDRYRISGNIKNAGGIDVVDGTGFEILPITSEGAALYADCVNSIAASLPMCNVYSILVPSMSEFYAPRELYKNQTASISEIYDQLRAPITPINALEIMFEHGNEKLYFMTDNHWTQRGAYYAYLAFANAKGFNIDPIDSFEKIEHEGFTGYWADYLLGSDLRQDVINNSEILEQYLPKRRVRGTIYNDEYMINPIAYIDLIDTSEIKYGSFISGDNPVTVLETDVPGDTAVCIIKESFGDAFATWAVNNYSRVYVIDPRQINGNFGFKSGRVKLTEFYEKNKFDDLIILNYPASVESEGFRTGLRLLIDKNFYN